MVSVTSSLCDLTIHLYTRLERVTVSKGMKEQLQSLDKSRDGLMVTFEHHAKVWRDLERKKEKRKEGPLRSGQPAVFMVARLNKCSYNTHFIRFLFIAASAQQ